MLNRVFCLVISLFTLTYATHATPLFSASTGNTTLFDNGYNYTSNLTLTDADSSLVLLNANGELNNGGFTSTDSISALLGENLTSDHQIALTIGVDSITGASIRANGITFGLAGAKVFGGDTTSNFMIGIKAANSGSHAYIINSFRDNGDLGFDVLESSLYDGFTITLTADEQGYTFQLDGIIVSETFETSATIEGTFSGTEFADYFSAGYFYVAAQKYKDGELSIAFNEATIEAIDKTEQYPLFFADFNSAAAITTQITANATADNLDSGTAVGTWSLPSTEPGAIISDGSGNNAFLFDQSLSGNTVNAVNAQFNQTVSLDAGRNLVIEMDLYAARQANSQRVEFALNDAEGNSAYTFVFRMNDDKEFYSLPPSGQPYDAATNATGVNNGYKNPALDGYLSWGATMVHVKAEISGQTTQAGNRGALLSIDWNDDGDYNDSGERVQAHIGPSSSGVTQLTALNISNPASGGAWIDNLSITTGWSQLSPTDNHVNLAKFQSVTSDGGYTDTPNQFANDGMVAADSRWVSAGSWWATTLATPMTIGSAHLFSGNTSINPISDFSLQYYSNNEWIDIPGATFTDNSSIDLNIVFDTPITAQQFRLYSLDGTLRIRELALYPPTPDGSLVPFGADLDLNCAKLRQYEYSSVSGANYPKLAIDGYANDASLWASANTAGPHDLEIYFPISESVKSIHLYSGYTDQAGTGIENFEIAYNNGNGWELFDGGSVTSNTALNRIVVFNEAVTTKSIRIRSLDDRQALIREFVVLTDNGGAGYPLWTDVKNEAPSTKKFTDYDDSYYSIKNRATQESLSSSADGSLTTSTEEPQFQVLLNIGTDSYRLRSKDTSACFEVALASTNAGAAIVEGTYASMPHQRWRIEETGDGTHVQIINEWSGLALDISGTNVIQQAISSEQSQNWAITYQTHYPKKGEAAHIHFNTMFKPSWVYDWRVTPKSPVTYGQYMPMKWGGIAATSPEILRYQPQWYAGSEQTTVLGFNEPDLEDQANMTESAAAYQWPRLERMRLPLGGPVPAAYKGSWRQEFEALAEERGLRSDYMTVHWYSPNGASTGSPSTLISNMKTLYDTYGKPIWLTEFSTRDFDGTKTTWSRNHNYNFLAEFIWRAETLDWLKKYSVFEWGIDTKDPANDDTTSADPTAMNSPRLSLHESNDSSDPGWEDLAECGLLLAGWDGNTETVDDTSYIIHNKGRFLRLMDHPSSNTVTHANVLNRNASEQFMLQTAPNGYKYIIGLSDGRRLSYNGSSVGLADASTTGSTVEWKLTNYQYGWVYIDHPSSGKRLRINSADTINMASGTDAYDTVRFRFIKHYQPITLAETQSIPYGESFENGIGAWRQFDVDDREWEVGSGTTPTTSAGPSGASDGSNYLFSEGHDAGANVTNSVQCVFDLSTVETAQILFDYHMYGSYISFLSIDIHDGTSWNNDVWKRTGQQHTSSTDPWTPTSLDLSAYAGNSAVTIRFRTANTAWNSADPAIDNIRITELVPTLPYLESFEDGIGSWQQSQDDDFNWSIGSGETPSGNTGPNQANHLSQYLYIEPNDIYDGHEKMAEIENTFSLKSVEHPIFSFDYHMYGANVDYLAVDLSDGTNWTTDVWTRTGSQQTSSDSDWLTAEIDLSSYAGNENVSIRIRAKQTYWHLSDIAIDTLRIEDVPLSEYELWAENLFNSAPEGTDTSATGNPDGDRFSNQVEWALNLDPLVSDLPIQETSISNELFIATYQRRDAALTGIEVYASWANALTSTVWRLDGDGLTEVSMGWNDGVESMEARLPLEHTNAYIRIEVK